MSVKHFLKKILYKVLDAQPFLYRPECKIFNHKFEIHKTDIDIWPSYPHMHSIEDNLVLNIYTGEVYRKITRVCISEAREKDMKKLWNDKRFLEIVLDVRKNKPINIKELDPIPTKWMNSENLKYIIQKQDNAY